MNTKNIFYILACLSFSTIIGAGIYEHIAIWPVAYSEAPRSLTMFQGAYAIQSANFWMPVHPVTLLLFIVALVLNWKTDRKKYLLAPLVIYMVILVVTFAVLVPELISLTTTVYSQTVDATITKRGHTWINLSLVRMAFLLVAYCILLLGLNRPVAKK